MNLNNKKVICCDLDGILNNYPRCWLDFIELEIGKRFFSLEEAKENLSKENYKEIKEKYRASDFKYDLKINKDILRLINLLKERYKIVLITSRPSNPIIIRRTKEWLDKNKVYYNGLVFIENKAEIKIKGQAIEFFIEDDLEDAEILAEKGYKVFLKNSKLKNKSIKPLDEIFEILENEENKGKLK